MDKSFIPAEKLPEGFLQGRSQKAYEYFGSHFLPDGRCRFTVWAPHAKNVSLVGDFNGWQVGATEMFRQETGEWTCTLPGFKQGDIYKYAIEWQSGKVVQKADPYAFHAETGPGTGSRVWDIRGYKWTDSRYMAARSKKDFLTRPVSVYEVHMGAWKKAEGEVFPNYRAVADALADYCVDMGYTHVELMPITEFPYPPSWGYQVTGYFAPTSRYGTPQDFMYFVDRLHKAGVGVIIDWVPAHFPKDAHGLGMFDGTPTYERNDEKMANHPEWGTLIFDYQKPPVKSFLLSSAAMFMDEYHVDGIRVDAVSSMLYLSYARNGDFTPNVFGGDTCLGAIDFLKDLTTLVRDRGGISIAEEATTYPGITKAVKDGGLGFDFKWDMGFMHDTLDYMKQDPIYRRHHHNKLTFSMMYAFSERYVLAFSHDEVVHGKCSMVNKMSGLYNDKFANLRCLYALQYGHPGKKHNFMGSEIAQFIEFNESREVDWFLLEYPKHLEMQRYVRELNRVYRSRPALYENEVNWEGFKWLNVNDADRSCISFMRISNSGEKLVCAINFTPRDWELQVGLPEKGKLWLLLNSDEGRFGGTDYAVPRIIKSSGKPFAEYSDSAFLKLPPLSAVYYTYKEDKK